MRRKRPKRQATEEERASTAAAIAPPAQLGTVVDAQPPAATSVVDSLWTVVERIIAPTTLLVALAYHFGRQYTSARSAYFGIDSSLLGFSTQDYLVRSADALLIPLGALALAGLVCVEIDRLACRAIDRAPPRARGSPPAVRALRIGGWAVLVLGVYGAIYGLPSWPSYLVPPLLPAVGTLLIALSIRLEHRRKRAAVAAGPPERVRNVLMAAVVVVSLFWAVTEYAQALGRGRAQTIAQHLERQHAAVVYSESRLGLVGPGVKERVINVPDSRYRYRYAGLRFVIRSGGAYFFLPEYWTRREGAAIVLPESAGLRFEFLALPKGGEW